MLGASSDDTLYDTIGVQLNNGAGEWLFAGKTAGGTIRRGLISFDIAAGLPSGATITGVSLTMNMSRTVAGETEIGLHRVLAHWQEGKADASGNEGGGASANEGDPTWTQRALNSLDWNTPGGDFSPNASAAVTIAAVGSYTWQSTSQIMADVQNWLDDPSANFGWLFRGDESNSRTTKRFDSRDNKKEANRPVLTVEYTL